MCESTRAGAAGWRVPFYARLSKQTCVLSHGVRHAHAAYATGWRGLYAAGTHLMVHTHEFCFASSNHATHLSSNAAHRSLNECSILSSRVCSTYVSIASISVLPSLNNFFAPPRTNSSCMGLYDICILDFSERGIRQSSLRGCVLLPDCNPANKPAVSCLCDGFGMPTRRGRAGCCRSSRPRAAQCPADAQARAPCVCLGAACCAGQDGAFIL